MFTLEAKKIYNGIFAQNTSKGVEKKLTSPFLG